MKKNKLVFLFAIMFCANLIVAQNDSICKVENMEFKKLPNLSEMKIKGKATGLLQIGLDGLAYLETSLTKQKISVYFSFAKTDEPQIIDSLDIPYLIKKVEKVLFATRKISFVPDGEFNQIEINGVTFDQYIGQIIDHNAKKAKIRINLITSVIDNQRYYSYSIVHTFSKKDSWELVKSRAEVHCKHLKSFKIY
jgi:hypothetical protein